MSICKRSGISLNFRPKLWRYALPGRNWTICCYHLLPFDNWWMSFSEELIIQSPKKHLACDLYCVKWLDIYFSATVEENNEMRLSIFRGLWWGCVFVFVLVKKIKHHGCSKLYFAVSCQLRKIIFFILFRKQIFCII